VTVLSEGWKSGPLLTARSEANSALSLYADPMLRVRLALPLILIALGASLLAAQSGSPAATATTPRFPTNDDLRPAISGSSLPPPPAPTSLGSSPSLPRLTNVANTTRSGRLIIPRSSSLPSEAITPSSSALICAAEKPLPTISRSCRQSTSRRTKTLSTLRLPPNRTRRRTTKSPRTQS
jgi:hypothetical protein